MGAKSRQTYEKMNRERAVREKRARKNEKKEQKKLAAQAALNPDAVAEPLEEDGVEAPVAVEELSSG
jgi:hypothetical protein